ncbi:MAG TPA: lactonase family protein [Devosiaceae bacterium]|nr:lactonase family protein [Devosiaceae bacterium]
MKSLLFVGGSNRGLPYVANTSGKGIAAFRVDVETGAAEPLGVTEGIDNPTFLAVTPDGRFLCAVSEVEGWNEGTITAYAIDVATGGLTYINKQPTRGDTTAHLGFDATGRFVASVNYTVMSMTVRPNRSVAVHPMAADGELGPLVAEVAHEGRGPDPARQARPHAHCARWTPDNRFVVVADLGIDKLITYAFDAASGKLAPHGELALPPGSGPRHFAFHPTLPFAYLINELASTVASLAFDAAGGKFQLLGIDSAIDPATSVKNYASAIKVAPGGRHLFAGNRGEDSLARFDIDPASGIARRAAATPTGKIPRDFDFAPGGNCLAVGNQGSDSVSLFRYYPEDGRLTPLGNPIAVGSPTAIAWVGA